MEQESSEKEERLEERGVDSRTNQELPKGIISAAFGAVLSLRVPRPPTQSHTPSCAAPGPGPAPAPAPGPSPAQTVAENFFQWMQLPKRTDHILFALTAFDGTQ